MDQQILKQKGFLTWVFRPQPLQWKNMREGHAHLLKRGLNDTHVDIVIEHLGATLNELGVGTEDIEQVASLANSVRDEVLGRS